MDLILFKLINLICLNQYVQIVLWSRSVGLFSRRLVGSNIVMKICRYCISPSDATSVHEWSLAVAKDTGRSNQGNHLMMLLVNVGSEEAGQTKAWSLIDTDRSLGSYDAVEEQRRAWNKYSNGIQIGSNKSLRRRCQLGDQQTLNCLTRSLECWKGKVIDILIPWKLKKKKENIRPQSPNSFYNTNSFF